MRIREARPEDGPALGGLLAELGYPDESAAVAARARALVGDPASFLLVAEDDDGLAGLASGTRMPLLHEEGGWCRLPALVVAKRCRRTGVGRSLVEEAESRARAAGCRYLEVTSGERPEREAAHSFYRTVGLVEVSRRYLKQL